jgi:hypothetical protein
MRTILLAVVLMAAVPGFAQSPPASEESIRELLALTNAKSVLEGAWDQMDGLMEKSMKDSLGDKKMTPKQEEVAAELRAKTVELIRTELSWDKLEPIYIKLYRDTYTQAELDGITDFYRSDAGKAMIAKMPQLTQALMQTLMTTMQELMPKARALGNEYGAKIRAAGN